MSLDGFIAGPNGEMDWMVWDWDDALKQYVQEITDPVDCIVLGRKLAQGFIPYWADVASNPDHPEHVAGLKFAATRKLIFTKTLEGAEWDHTFLAKGDLAAEINQLKKQNGNDIIAYGGAAFVSSLIKERLIDEYHFFVNPTILGEGMAIFKEVQNKQNLQLVKATAFDCGIVVHHYEPKLG